MENWFDYVIGGIFILVVGNFIYRIIRNGGFKAAMFSQRIIRTVGEVSGQKQSLVSTTVKVHALGSGSRPQAIGLEFVSKSILSYQMVPATLSVEQTRKLIAVLEAAVAGAETP